ncbi:uncharacterized protein LOC107267364 isoform X2 [Cephus cinctus]|uniref:Uncharacterized protein LOC107267364 isoform X2 n=1 Tax=Cephus cinctus TaxID=211228 RepID=A0AAJ7RGD2_CEPCN|nr:uncharacterized protein LOC107267364 isoform X2 [Cephus cinctus]
MASNNQRSPFASHTKKSNGNKRNIKESQQKVLSQVNEMFHSVLDPDIILSVVQNCNWKLQPSIDGLITLSANVDVIANQNNQHLSNQNVNISNFVTKHTEDSCIKIQNLDKNQQDCNVNDDVTFLNLNDNELQRQQEEFRKFEQLKKDLAQKHFGSTHENMTTFNYPIENKISSNKIHQFNQNWPISQTVSTETDESSSIVNPNENRNDLKQKNDTPGLSEYNRFSPDLPNKLYNKGTIPKEFRGFPKPPVVSPSDQCSMPHFDFNNWSKQNPPIPGKTFDNKDLDSQKSHSNLQNYKQPISTSEKFYKNPQNPAPNDLVQSNVLQEQQLRQTPDRFPSPQNVARFRSTTKTYKSETESLCGLKVQYRLPGLENSSDDDADVVIEAESSDYRIQNPSLTSISAYQFLPSFTQSPPCTTHTEVRMISTPSPPRTPRHNSHEILLRRIKSAIQQGSKILVLMRGLPGSGKSYLARSIVSTTIAEDPAPYIFNTDDYFIMIGQGVYQFDSNKLQEAHSFNKRRVRIAMEEGRSPIIIDNTNTKSWEMQPYVTMAVAYGYIVEVLEPNTPWVQNVNELAKKNRHGVPKAKIKAMMERYERNVTGHFGNVLGPRIQDYEQDSELMGLFMTKLSDKKMIEMSDEKTVENDEEYGIKISKLSEPESTESSKQLEMQQQQYLGAIGSERKGSICITECDSPEEDNISVEQDNTENVLSQCWDFTLLLNGRQIHSVYPSSSVSDKVVIPDKSILSIIDLTDEPTLSKPVDETNADQENILSCHIKDIDNENMLVSLNDNTESDLNDLSNNVIEKSTVIDCKNIEKSHDTDSNSTSKLIQQLFNAAADDIISEKQIEEVQNDDVDKIHEHDMEVDEAFRMLPSDRGFAEWIQKFAHKTASMLDESSRMMIDNYNIERNTGKQEEIESTNTDEVQERKKSDSQININIQESDTSTSLSISNRPSTVFDKFVEMFSLIPKNEENDKLVESVQVPVETSQMNMYEHSESDTEEIKDDKEITNDLNNSTGQSEVNKTSLDNMIESDTEEMTPSSLDTSSNLVSRNNSSDENTEVIKSKVSNDKNSSNSEEKQNRKETADGSIVFPTVLETSKEANPIDKDDKNIITLDSNEETLTAEHETDTTVSEISASQQEVDVNDHLDEYKEIVNETVKENLGDETISLSKSVKDFVDTIDHVDSKVPESSHSMNSNQHKKQQGFTSIFKYPYYKLKQALDRGTHHSGNEKLNVEELLNETSANEMKKDSKDFKDLIEQGEESDTVDSIDFDPVDKSVNEDMALSTKDADPITVGQKHNEVIDNIRQITWKESPFPVDEILLPLSKEESKSVMTSDVSTNTSSYDFNVSYVGGTSEREYTVVDAFNRSINEGLVFTPVDQPPLKLMLDKSSMTGEVNILSSDDSPDIEIVNDTEDRIIELMDLFPNIPKDHLMEIYGKLCNYNFNWAVDVLLEGIPDDGIKYQKPESSNNQGIELLSCTEMTLDKKSNRLKQQSTSSESNDSESNAQSQTGTPKKKKDKNRVSEANLVLKKQIEEKLKISDASYNPHILRVKRWKNGEPDITSDEIIEQQTLNKEAIEFADFSNLEDDGYTMESSSLLTTENATSLPEQYESTESTDDDSEEGEMMELNLGQDFIQILANEFGDPEFELPDGLFPVIQIKKSMAQGLYALWVESMQRQLDAQQEQLDQMIAKDAEYAKSVQQEEARALEEQRAPNLHEMMDMEMALAIYNNDMKEQMKRETSNDLASRLTRQMLHEMFPTYNPETLNEILNAHSGHFKETVEVLQMSTGQQPDKPDTLKKQKILMDKVKQECVRPQDPIESSSPFIVVNPDLYVSSKTEQLTYDNALQLAQDARKEAQRQFSLRNENFNKAANAHRKGNPEVATYYSNMAKLHSKNMEIANSTAASAFLAAQDYLSNEKNTLDLHNLFVPEALQALEVFLDYHLNKLRKKNKRSEYLYIITGRGARSNNGQSKIKPAVSKRLHAKNIRFTDANPGCLQVIIRKCNAVE